MGCGCTGTTPSQSLSGVYTQGELNGLQAVDVGITFNLGTILLATGTFLLGSQFFPNVLGKKTRKRK